MNRRGEALLNERDKPKVLIVDDMKENVELMEAYLQSNPMRLSAHTEEMKPLIRLRKKNRTSSFWTL